MSPEILKLNLFKRSYYTYAINKNLSVNYININKSIKFDSLEQGCEEIKFKYLGVSGVYILTNINNDSRFYIGSSVNLARRMEEYNKLTKGLRKPRSNSELENFSFKLKFRIYIYYYTSNFFSLWAICHN